MSEDRLKRFRAQIYEEKVCTREHLDLNPEPLERFLEPRKTDAVEEARLWMLDLLFSVRNCLFPLPLSSIALVLKQLSERDQFDLVLDTRREYMRRFFEQDRQEVNELKAKGEYLKPEAEIGDDEDQKIKADQEQVRAMLEPYRHLFLTATPGLIAAIEAPEQVDLILASHTQSAADRFNRERANGKINDEYGFNNFRAFFTDRVELPNGWEWNQNMNGLWVLSSANKDGAYQIFGDSIAFSTTYSDLQKAPRIGSAKVIGIETQSGTTRGRGLWVNPAHADMRLWG